MRKLKLGVILPNWIGDVVMTTPTLRALRKHYGEEAEIIAVHRPYVTDVLAGLPWLDGSILWERKSADRSMHFWGTVCRLRQWAPDVMLVLPNSLRTAALAWLSGAGDRLGYARDGRSLLLTERLSAPRNSGGVFPVSAVDYYLRLAYVLGCPPESRQLELATTSRDEQGADAAWNAFGLTAIPRVVIFNTGSASGPARNWPSEYYVELARRLLADPQLAILAICGPGERDLVREITRLVQHPRFYSMADQDLSLGVAKACVRRGDVMVTTDSGPRHFAAAFRVPVVTLFGPIDHRWSDSHHPDGVNLQHPVACRPCGKKKCPLAYHACMREITVDSVERSVLRLLRNRPRRAA